jgi:hypothetical protein
MHSIQTLEIMGYRDERVPNTFFRNDEGTEQLAIILPGMGYTCHMPLLYYQASCCAAWARMCCRWSMLTIIAPIINHYQMMNRRNGCLPM